MKVRDGYKRWVIFRKKEGAPACVDYMVSQRIGERAMCGSCGFRRPGLEFAYCVDVSVDQKADAGSEKAGLKTYQENPTCCHAPQRVEVSDDFPQLRNALEDGA